MDTGLRPKNKLRLEFGQRNAVMKKAANITIMKQMTAILQKHQPGNHSSPISRLLSHIQKKFHKKFEKSCNKKTSSAIIYIVFDDW